MSSHKKKTSKNVYIGITVGLLLAVLVVSIASVTSLPGSVTPGYNCSVHPVRRGSQWQNRKNTLDVNADGVVTQEDANIVIAKLNENSEKTLWKIRPKLKTPPYIDVDGDMKVAPIDALHIANYLNNCIPDASGEGKMQTNPWHNYSKPADVNGDGFVSPVDVLAVINEINQVGSHALDQSGPAQAFKIDTNNDGYVSPVDVMIVNNALNNQ